MELTLTTGEKPDIFINHVATGKQARKVRTSHKISLREIARRMDISAPFLSDLERGRRNWNLTLVESFNMALTLHRGKAK
jgi:transcriptional regulator with XRE-family HTH domain